MRRGVTKRSRMKRPLGNMPSWAKGLFLSLTCWSLTQFSTALAQEEQVLFTDNFDVDSSQNWNVLSAQTEGEPDFTAEFSYDYSQDGIPPAPGASGQTTRGVKLTVNKDDFPAGAAVNISPKNQSFSGNYALRFDMWLNYPGGPYGEGGLSTTEFALFGINHSGASVAWQAPASDTNATDGVWFAVTGEGGSSRDYRAYVGNPEGAPIELRGEAGGFLDRDGDGIAAVDVIEDPFDPSDAELEALFPAPDFETPGAPGKRWVRVEVVQQSGEIIWKIEGHEIARRANTSPYDSGTIVLGLMDIFIEVAHPKEDAFVIYDNVDVVRVEPGTAPLPTDLRILRAGDSVRISFIGGGFADQYRLQSRSELNPTGAWVDSAVRFEKVGDRFEVSVPIQQSLEFFRIKALGQ